ncbi:MAG: preprotein translocase subunit YajC [Bacteriovoracaceae bacterium]|nr:preprotein translocase subunit YajC [Bacteriovoracaceae bacterium]
MIDLLISSAFAQEAAAAANQTSPLASMAPFAIIFVIFYFLMIRPQKKKMQQEQALVASLGKGDEVFTKSGILGTITGLTEKIVTLEVSEGVKFKIIRNEIAGKASKLFEKSEGSDNSSKTKPNNKKK